MASPIEATPTLRGKDAKRLLSDLKSVCSPEESARRIRYAKEQVAEMMRPKITRVDVDPSK
jgi:hypothetical protein